MNSTVDLDCLLRQKWPSVGMEILAWVWGTHSAGVEERKSPVRTSTRRERSRLLSLKRIISLHLYLHTCLAFAALMLLIFTLIFLDFDIYSLNFLILHRLPSRGQNNHGRPIRWVAAWL